MLIRVSYILFFYLIIVSTYAQKASAVIKANAFYKVHLPGLNKMDEYGNSLAKIDTSYFIYLIIKGNVEPKIEKVVFNGIIYGALVFPLEGKQVHIGKLKGPKKAIDINAGYGQTIWRVELQVRNNDTTVTPIEYNKFKLIFQKKLHWKSFEMQAGLEIEPEEYN